jgi:hypothetical protein
LKRVVGALAGHARACQPAKLLVDKRQQLFSRSGLTSLNRLK